MTFTPEQLDELQKAPPAESIKTRKIKGVELAYIEAHHALDEANRIFGFHSWNTEITKLEQAGDVWYCTMALTVTTDDGEIVRREDVGVGIPAVARDADEATSDAVETGIKGAVSDAVKRCLRTFGAAFGNSLYAKSTPAPVQQQQQRQVNQSTGEITDDGEDRPCPNCDQPMVLRSGTTRDGRPYSAWFCSAKCGAKPIWLADKKS